MAERVTQPAKGIGFTRRMAKDGIRQIGSNKWEVRVHAGRDPLAGKLRQKSTTVEGGIKDARKQDFVPVDVARHATPPSVPKKELTIPPPERVRVLMERAAASPSLEWATIITLAALTGTRRRELCGLQRSDIDWEGSALTVRRSTWQTSAGWGVKLPKTHQIRRLPFGPEAMAVLAGRLKRVTDAAKSAEVEVGTDAYVFSPEIDGARPMMPSAVTPAFRRLGKRSVWSDPKEGVDRLPSTHCLLLLSPHAVELPITPPSAPCPAAR